MTVGLLKTEGFPNLKYCIRSKGLLEHLEAFLCPSPRNLHVWWQATTYQWCQVASMWTDIE